MDTVERDMNVVRITGNLAREPELRYSAKGTAWTTGSIAYNHSNTVSSFFDFKAFRETAEGLAELEKGDKVLLSGQLHQEKWTAADGSNRYAVRIFVEEYTILRRKNPDSDPVQSPNEEEEGLDPYANAEVERITSLLLKHQYLNPVLVEEEGKSIILYEGGKTRITVAQDGSTVVQGKFKAEIQRILAGKGIKATP